MIPSSSTWALRGQICRLCGHPDLKMGHNKLFSRIDSQEVNFQSLDHFLMRSNRVEFTVDCSSSLAAAARLVGPHSTRRGDTPQMDEFPFMSILGPRVGQINHVYVS